jgi:hypothetical protein
MPHPQDDESDFVHTTCPSLEASRTTCLTEKHGQSRRSPSTQEGRRGPSGSTRNYNSAHHCCPCICCFEAKPRGVSERSRGHFRMAGPLQLYLAMTTERLSTDPGREHWCDGEPGRQPLAGPTAGCARSDLSVRDWTIVTVAAVCLAGCLHKTSSTSYRLLSFQPTRPSFANPGVPDGPDRPLIHQPHKPNKRVPSPPRPDLASRRDSMLLHDAHTRVIRRKQCQSVQTSKRLARSLAAVRPSPEPRTRPACLHPRRL